MNFTIGQEYRCRTLHDQYGGRRQGGIAPSAKVPAVFLFTGTSGEQHGYHDGFQPDGTFWYTGEGQIGDMRMVQGNRAINDAEKEGRELHLFEQTRPGFVRYLGSVHCLGYHEATAPDTNGNTRKVIVFELELTSGVSGATIPDMQQPTDSTPGALWHESIDKLRARALAVTPKDTPPAERRVKVRERSQAVRVYVLRRAQGVCECCGTPAPFSTPKGTPYLEPHHISRVADGGPDHPRWVAAFCPNCHRHIHDGHDGNAINTKLAAYIGQVEPDDTES